MNIALSNPQMHQPDEFVPSSQVRAELGGISDMTLWRWLKDSDLCFPQPVTIRGRRYWERSKFNAWKTARAHTREAA